MIYKVYEKLIHNRLRPWLERNNLPPPLQHAGRQGHSSITLSYTLQEVINHHINAHGTVYGCLLDLEQAFDKISWNCLLYKLAQISIKDKLWWIFRNSLFGSSCMVLLNGKFSPSFPISRSIKQGGMLSMFYFIIAYYDVHEYVSQSGDSLQYIGRDVGSLTLADDTFLLSNTVNGLQNMINLAAEYGHKWRLVFSPAKTKCVTFGETKVKNKKNVTLRQWHMNNITIDEVQHFVHVGVKMCSYMSTQERTKYMSKKGFSIYGKLLSCGVNNHGLSPMTSSHIWHRMSIPSMLYGCELWGEMPKSQINVLEKVQKTVAKSLHGFNWRTHDEIVRGLLGWQSIIGYIDKMKLLFVHRLVKSTGIIKYVFLNQIYMYIVSGVTQKSITCDLYNVLVKYDLDQYILRYMYGGVFPQKMPWKSMIKEQILKSEQQKWESGLVLKRATRFLAIQGSLKPNILYTMLRTHEMNKKEIMRMIRMLTIEQTDEEMLCIKCKKTLVDSVEHTLLRCEGLLSERSAMWDELLDVLDVQAEAVLLAKPDEDILHILLGKNWNGFINVDQRAEFYRISAKHIFILTTNLGI